MFNRKLAATFGLSLAVVAGSVFAQQNAGRRERLRNAAEAAAGVAQRVADSPLVDDVLKGGLLKGGVITLQGEPRGKTKEINVGGLVMVRVPDTGSRPLEGLQVEAGDKFQRLGQVRGARERRGESQQGGGFTLVLFRAASEGEGTITISYSPSDGGTAVTRQHKVNVTAPDAGTP